MKYVYVIIFVFATLCVQAQQKQFVCATLNKDVQIMSSYTTNMGMSVNTLDLGELNTWIPDCKNGMPLHNPPITTINLTFHVILATNGGNCRYTNDEEGKNKLKQLVIMTNNIYSGKMTAERGWPSDKVANVIELPNYDTRIRFSLGEEGKERIYYYYSDYYNKVGSDYAYQTLPNYVATVDPARLNYGVNVFFIASSYYGATAYSVDYESKSYVVFFETNKSGENTEWIAGSSLAHEIGHNLKLAHTYCGGGASAVGCVALEGKHSCSESHEYNDAEYLSDIFGPCGATSTFPHKQKWEKPYETNDPRITSNVMGGTINPYYFSPMQAGQMHRALAFGCIGQYVQKGTYSDLPLVIKSTCEWKKEIRLFRDLTIEKNGYLTLSANYTLNQNTSIIVKNGGVLRIGASKNVNVNSTNKIVVENGGTLIISGNLDVLGTGAIDVQSGGYLCVENTSKVNLADVLSVIRLHSGAKLGVNTTYVKNTGGYCASVGALSSKKTGNGKVVSSYSSDVYIQNKTFTTSAYFSGKNIYVNDVVVKSGCTIMLDAESEVYLNKNVDVQKGGSIETVGKY